MGAQNRLNRELERGGEQSPPYPALCTCGHSYILHMHFSAQQWCHECGKDKTTGQYKCEYWEPDWLITNQRPAVFGEQRASSQTNKDREQSPMWHGPAEF